MELQLGSNAVGKKISLRKVPINPILDLYFPFQAPVEQPCVTHTLCFHLRVLEADTSKVNPEGKANALPGLVSLTFAA